MSGPPEEVTVEDAQAMALDIKNAEDAVLAALDEADRTRGKWGALAHGN
jgi:hypothetical protein